VTALYVVSPKQKRPPDVSGGRSVTLLFWLAYARLAEART